jgi:hypothetical protein
MSTRSLRRARCVHTRFTIAASSVVAKISADGGFSLDVSDADGDLKAQVTDAIRLLAEW